MVEFPMFSGCGVSVCYLYLWVMRWIVTLRYPDLPSLSLVHDAKFQSCGWTGLIRKSRKIHNSSRKLSCMHYTCSMHWSFTFHTFHVTRMKTQITYFYILNSYGKVVRNLNLKIRIYSFFFFTLIIRTARKNGRKFGGGDVEKCKFIKNHDGT